MPKAPLPPDVAALFARPNPAVVAVLMPGGAPMSVATWYLVEDDGTVLLNMDAGRARLEWMRERPEVALTALKEDPATAGIPVIMHSSLSGLQNQHLGISVGVDEYVSKFEPQKLAEVLARRLTA